MSTRNRDPRASLPASLVSRMPNANMQAAPDDLLRAAGRARGIAGRNGTPLIIFREGVLMEIHPGDPLFDYFGVESDA